MEHSFKERKRTERSARKRTRRPTLHFSEDLRQVKEQHFQVTFWNWGPTV